MPDLPSPPEDSTKPDSVIVDSVTTGMPRVLNGQKNRIGISQQTKRTRRVRASAEDEYVSAGQQLWTANYLRSLSFAVDDITAIFGDDLYDRMMQDGQVSSDIETLIMSILAQGVEILPAVKEFETDAKGKRVMNPDYPRAKEIAEFVKRNLSDMCGAFDPQSAGDLYWSLHDMLLAIPFGCRVAELIYVLPKRGVDKGKICLKSIKVKPRRSTTFVVDVYQNICGLLSLIPGMGAPLVLQGLVTVVDQMPNLLPRRKFAILTWRPKNNDPRGTSHLRGAYDAWFVKQQIKLERLKWYAQLAGGSVVGFTAPDSTSTAAYNADGSLQVDTNGNPIAVTPEQAMLTSLLSWQSGIAAAFPPGAKVEVHYPAPESPFDAGLDRQDREISKAVLFQTRMGNEAQHGSKADSETGQDVFGILVSMGKQAVEGMLRRDVVAPLVEYNYGEDSLHLCPQVSLSRTEHQDFAENATAVASLQTAGYLAPSQLSETDAMLGLPIRTESETDAAGVGGQPSPMAVNSDPGGVDDDDDSDNPPAKSKKSKLKKFSAWLCWWNKDKKRWEAESEPEE